MAEKLAGSEAGLSDVVRLMRAEQDAALLARAKGDLQKALELWASDKKKRRAKAGLPSWWKNAAAKCFL